MPERVVPVEDRVFAANEIHQSAVIDIDNDIDHVTLSVDRTLLPVDPGMVCRIVLRALVPPGGWQDVGEISFAGGEHINRGGHVAPFTTMTKPLPEGAIGRKVQPFIEVTVGGRYKIELDQLIIGNAPISRTLPNISG